MERLHATFNNTSEVIPTLIGILHSEGQTFQASAGNSTGQKRSCTEIRGGAFKITDWSDRKEMMQENGLSVTFAEFDLLDRLSLIPVNPGKAVQFDEIGVLSKHLDENGKLKGYTYSERICDQLGPVVKLIKEHPDTRQAFISIWDRTLDPYRAEWMRVPCSIGFHFLRREDKLDLVYYMRSLEVTKCLGNDMYTSTRFLEEMAKRVGVEVGAVTFMVGSLHMFD